MQEGSAQRESVSETTRAGQVSSATNAAGAKSVNVLGDAVAVLGAGDMAGAVTRSLIKAPVFSTAGAPQVRLTTHRSTPSWAEGLPNTSFAQTATNPEANREAVRGAGFVMLGVMPDQMEALATEIAPHLEPGAVVVSVAAAPGLAALERILPDTVGVVRAMPNLPVDIGEGVIGLVRGTHVSDEQLATVVEMLDPTGLVVTVDDEAQLDLFTAIPGGAPAYVSYFIDAMVQASVRQGMAADDAWNIVLASFRGLIARLDAYAGDSENGTTAGVKRGMLIEGNVTHTGISHLEAHGVADTISDAIAAGVGRAREFSAR